MSCLFTVRTCDALKQWEFDEWTAYVALASLSAEPETFSEFLDAMRRYQPEHRLAESARDVSDIAEANGAEMWCLVDVIGRTVVSGGEFEFPERPAAYEPLQDEPYEGFRRIWMDLPADWIFHAAEAEWQSLIRDRAVTAALTPRIDSRAVLFGDPLLEFLADGVLTHSEDLAGADRDRVMELTRSIHAQWLMTAREDLLGRTPRQLLVADYKRLGEDMQHRSYQWQHQGHAPLELSRDSAAYRLGGFGTIEVVIYFELVRALLRKAWQLARKTPDMTRAHLVQRLASERDRWLQLPYEDLGMTAAELIDSERRRVPITSNGSHLHCDCPICRAEADGLFGSGPVFVWFDGHHLELEDEFAFSMTETFAEWQQEQNEFRRYAERLQASTRDADEAGEESPGDELASESVWKSSFVDWDQVTGPDSSPEHALFSLAFPLAEIVSDLQSRSAGRDHMHSLNGAYDILRRSTDPAAARSAANRFCAKLEEVCRTFPDLTPKCADLQSHVHGVLRRFV